MVAPEMDPGAGFERRRRADGDSRHTGVSIPRIPLRENQRGPGLAAGPGGALASAGRRPLTAAGPLDHDRGVAQAGGDRAVARAAAGLGAWVLASCTVPTEGFVDPRGELRIEWSFDAESATVHDGAAPAEDLALAGGQWVMDEGPPHVRLDGIDDVGVGPDLQAWLPTLAAVTLEALVRIDAQPGGWDRRPIVTVPQTASSGNYSLSLDVYTEAERRRRDASAWTLVQGVLAPYVSHFGYPPS